ncbi:hypothetical protein PG996_012555 [Apiospora saccharicola]|uniref:Uncharacterized protein n=1 Tax=Apiospora saccharicola TaxID=335842 RepID=A0ABR1U5Q7_9PEZI
MAPTTGENIAENDAFAGPSNASHDKPSASLTPWVIIAITAASFLAATFIGFIILSLMRRRQRQRQRLGANAAAAVKQHNNKYYYRQHSREASFERPWPSPSKSQQNRQQPEEVAELQRSQLIGKSRASRESWSSYGGSVVVADATYLPQSQSQISFSRPHAYTAVSAHDHHHTTPSSTSTAGEAGASRNHEQYRYDNGDSEDDDAYESAPKKSMSSSDWKELEAQDGRLRSSSLQDPATLGRGHPAFSPELQRAQLPAKLPRTMVVADLAGRRGAP